ncbi:M20 family metallopeptidase [Embleya scabrispora]|uniref:M20 family metallopeptidase n=1 Tax=Embleya scabrispora TaxID=159449 RepID=UPI00036A8614|nr:M20 family metallopeptidase [Embleya scabrispora]MYS84922.1 ArgE/DapE family deacylase [Streptomyces sp. SID5474]
MRPTPAPGAARPPVEAFVRADRVRETAVELVRIDTRNPPGRESAAVPTLSNLLAALGCDTHVFTSRSGRPSVIARYGRTAPGRPTLLINGHVDVVPVVESDWTVPPFEGVVRDGRLIGRGAADMKGGIAAAIEGLRACVDSGVELGADIVFHLVADEETGGDHGTAELVAAGLVRADACIVPEPTELRVAVAERGSWQAEIQVFGTAGHGGDPGRGRSAVADAARITTALHLARFHAHPHPLLGSPTCNVAMVRGGVAANVIAPSCELTIDRRTLPGESARDVHASIVRMIDASCPDVDYRVVPTFFCEASELPLPHPFADFVDACRPGAGPDRAGPNEGFVGLYLGSDARFLRNDLHIPTVVHGPGSIRQAHGADEWVALDDLTAAARTLARAMAGFADFAADGAAADRNQSRQTTGKL